MTAPHRFGVTDPGASRPPSPFVASTASGTRTNNAAFGRERRPIQVLRRSALSSLQPHAAACLESRRRQSDGKITRERLEGMQARLARRRSEAPPDFASYAAATVTGLLTTSRSPPDGSSRQLAARAIR